MNYLQLLAPDFLLILCGLLLCRFTALRRPVWEQVEILTYYLLFPVLLFQSIVKSRIDLAATSGLVAAGVSLCAVGVGLSYALPHLPLIGRAIDRREHAGAAQVAFRFNTFVAFALAERVGGAQGLLLIAVLAGCCVPLLNTAAVWPMARHAQRGLARELLRNPLIIATVSGLAANQLGFAIPIWIEPAASRIGAASLALGLLATGAGMHFGSLASSKRLSVSLLTVRHVAMPLAALGLCRLYGLPAAQGQILMVFAGVPTASSCYVLAARMGYNGPYVASLVALSTLLAAASLPFALGLPR